MKRLVVLFTILASIGFYGCKTGANDAPPEVLSSFFDALAKKDIDAAKELSTKESASMLDMMAMGMKGDTTTVDNKYKKENMEFGEAKIQGDTAAIVPVKEKTTGEVVNYRLKKEEGKWKVAFDKASLMSIGEDKMKEDGVDPQQKIDEGMRELNNINMDSMKKAMQESMPNVEKADTTIH